MKHKKYAGWPERLYVIGTNGKITYAGDMGPMGFDPGSWEEALRKKSNIASFRGRRGIRVGEGVVIGFPVSPQFIIIDYYISMD